MKCKHAKKMISQYVDDELSPTRKRDIESHIRSCASCRDRLEEARDLHMLLSSAERFPAPYGFATRVLATLNEKKASRIPRLLGFRPLIFRAAQVALAIIVMTIGIISGSLLHTERPDRLGQTAVQESFSIELFQATPPGSIGGIYNTLMRPS